MNTQKASKNVEAFFIIFLQMSSLSKLIRSLSNGEKRNFTAITSAYNKNADSLELFQILSRRGLKDTGSIELDGKLISGNELAQKKRTLKQLILKSLRTNKHTLTPYERTINHLLDAELLFQRKFVTEALRSIRKAKKIASKREFYGLLMETLQLEFKFMQSNEDDTRFNPEIKVEFQIATQRNVRLLEVQMVLGQLLELKKLHGHLPENERKKMEKIVPDGFLSEVYALDSERIRFYQIWGNSLYHFLLKNPYKEYREIRELRLEDFDDVIATDELINAMLHKVACCSHVCAFEEALSNLATLRTYYSKHSIASNKPLQEQLFYYSANYGLTAAIFSEDAGRIHSSIEEIESYLNSNHSAPLIVKQVLLGNIGTAYFYLGEFKKSMKTFNELLQLGRSKLRTDVLENCYTIIPVILLVMNEFDLMESFVRSGLRILEQSKRNDMRVSNTLKYLLTIDPSKTKYKMDACKALSVLTDQHLLENGLLPPPKSLAKNIHRGALDSSTTLDLSSMDFVHLTTISILCHHWNN